MRRSILFIVAIALLTSGLSYSIERGIKVQARLPSSGEMITLYDQSWAVIIGINRYEKWPSLQYAVNDAKAVRDKLLSLGFPEENILFLTDEEATKVAIERVLGDRLRRNVGKDDRVFIYFAGHGQTEDLPGNKQEGYIVPVDGDKSDLFSTCISMTTVRQFSERMAAKHVFYAIDACYSGLALVRAGELDPKDREYLQKVARYPSRQLVTAGSAGEQVMEQGGHGAFTRSLLIALGGSADKFPPYGVLTGSELGNYLKPVVSVETNNAQTPQFGRLSAGEGEFMFVLQEGLTEAVSEAERAKAEAEAAKRETERLRQQVEAERARKETEAAKAEAERLRRELARMKEGGDRVKESDDRVSAPSGGEITVTLPGGATMEMIWIPSGSFTMGSPDSDGMAYEGEKPQHKVTISEGFYLGKYEITEGQWASVMGGAAGQPDHPKAEISWDDVQEFIGKLNQAEGSEVYRLPTEAEWEYACRAGTNSRWSFGDSEGQLGSYAWYGENSGYEAHTVGTKLPNGWGLYDMHGNVWEWVHDRYGSYTSGSQADPTGAASGSNRVLRGGGFYYSAQDARSADRGSNSPGFRGSNLGARLLRQGR